MKEEIVLFRNLKMKKPFQKVFKPSKIKKSVQNRKGKNTIFCLMIENEERN